MKNSSDEAVSPVIAVILMVAITVVLAAVVYVWVSGFSTSGVPAGTLSLIANPQPDNENTSLTVSSTQGLTWDTISLRLDGVALPYSTTLLADGWCYYTTSCQARPSTSLNAGEAIRARGSGSLLVVDDEANGVILTLRLDP